MELYALTDNMILEKIGENIKRMRLEHNISQKELASSAGVAISSIAALERGENNVRTVLRSESLIRVFIALGIGSVERLSPVPVTRAV